MASKFKWREFAEETKYFFKLTYVINIFITTSPNRFGTKNIHSFLYLWRCFFSIIELIANTEPKILKFLPWYTNMSLVSVSPHFTLNWKCERQSNEKQRVSSLMDSVISQIVKMVTHTHISQMDRDPLKISLPGYWSSQRYPAFEQHMFGFA